MLPTEPLEALERLARLLCDAFEAPELRRLVEFAPACGDLALNLPGPDSSKAALSHEIVKGLHARRALDSDFFARLEGFRPKRTAEFRAVQDALNRDLPLRSSPPSRSSEARALLERFTTSDGGRRRLESVLQAQSLIGNDADMAARIADIASLECFGPGDTLILEGAADSDILLLLVGSATVEVHGESVATRRAGQHVGEMTLIDPTQRRSATIRAREATVVARIDESGFARLAQRAPELWRRLAVELAARLRERGDLVPRRPERPLIFVGSTAGHLSLARKLAASWHQEPWDVRLWSDGPLGAGMSPLDSFVAQRDQIAVAVIVGSAEEYAGGPRAGGDHSLLQGQIGAALGRLGPGRTLLIRHGHAGEVPTPIMVGLRCLELSDDLDNEHLAAIADEARTIINHQLSS
ncbi:MAG: cyclic nucleotide-binding domain-containing protein [Myxococcales bacterium]|nr:cyclic nucleotide-binding domain-containing protein [Myxococcales bacterium]